MKCHIKSLFQQQQQQQQQNVLFIQFLKLYSINIKIYLN
jgi:hypothetical protein